VKPGPRATARNYGKVLTFERMSLFAGPNCPVPPWSRTVGEPRTPRSFTSANGSVSHRISMTDALVSVKGGVISSTFGA
jgi:hypothetical protein